MIRKTEKCAKINCHTCAKKKKEKRKEKKRRYFPRFSFSVVTAGLDDFPVVDPILMEIFLGGAPVPEFGAAALSAADILLFRRSNPALPELPLVELRRFGPPEVNLTNSSSSSSSRRRFSDNRSGGDRAVCAGGVVAAEGSCLSCPWACAGSVFVSMASSSSSSG